MPSVPTAGISERLGLRRRGIRREQRAHRGVPALLGLRRGGRRPCERWPRISRASIAGARIEDALRRIAATTACHAAVKANQPLTHREDGAHARRAPPHGVFQRLPARPPGRAAHHAPRDREELPAHLTGWPLAAGGWWLTAADWRPIWSEAGSHAMTGSRPIRLKPDPTTRSPIPRQLTESPDEKSDSTQEARSRVRSHAMTLARDP